MLENLPLLNAWVTTMKVNEYVTLGRSGLKVSPICLGAMTFGEDWGWGSSETAAAEIFNKYIEAGGNFIDTADMYVNGKSEEMLGKFVHAQNLRDRLVIATKFTFNGDPGNPNAGGNGRKNIYRALESSLRRLKMDYVDLYWLHSWDMVTPAEEVLLTMNDLIREGKIRYFGLSDVPAWYVAKMQTLADLRLMNQIVALQLEYSLIERNIEREHIPAAQNLGIGVCPWSPLAGGLLSGKYKRDSNGVEGRLNATKDNPVFNKFTERNWRILDTLLDVANKMGKPPAEVALSWVFRRPGVTSTLIGATKISQLESNMSAIELEIPPALMDQLNAASELEQIHPYVFFSPTMQSMITGGTSVRTWHPAAVV